MRPGSAGWRQIRVMRLKNIPGGATRDNLRAVLLASEVVDHAAMPEAGYTADVFAIIVSDDAMVAPGQPRSIHQNDRAYIDPKIEPKPGDIVVAMPTVNSDEYIVRELGEAPFDPQHKLVNLIPYNKPRYVERLVPADQVLGVVISIERKI